MGKEGDYSQLFEKIVVVPKLAIDLDKADPMHRNVAHPVAFITFKSFHTTSTKRPIALVWGLNI